VLLRDRDSISRRLPLLQDSPHSKADDCKRIVELMRAKLAPRVSKTGKRLLLVVRATLDLTVRPEKVFASLLSPFRFFRPTSPVRPDYCRTVSTCAGPLTGSGNSGVC